MQVVVKIDQSIQDTNAIIKLFERFNSVIIKFIDSVEFPLFREIYGVSSRNFKFQISIAMIVSSKINKLIKQYRHRHFSYLEDLGYKAPSTSSTKMNKLINSVRLNDFIKTI